MRTRRNFLGNLLLSGAGFFILPAAKLEKRIWVPDRKIVLATVRSIWCDYYLSNEPEDVFGSRFYPPQIKPRVVGAVAKFAGALWYATPKGWRRLKPLTNKIAWADDSKRAVKSAEIEAAWIKSCWSGMYKPSYREDGSAYDTITLKEAMREAAEASKLPIPEIMPKISI